MARLSSYSIGRLLAVVNAVSPYPVLCFNVGAHVDEVAGNACAAVAGGLVQKCAVLPATCWHGLLDKCQTPYTVIVVLLLEQRCALIVWRVVYDSLDRL